MSSSETAASEISNVRLVEYKRTRYVVNTASVDIERLQYSTVTFGRNYASSVPTFEIRTIPSMGAVPIEEVDRYEDGQTIWQFSEVDWSNGEKYRGTEKRSSPRNNWDDSWSVIEREKTMIGDPNPPQVFDDDEK